MFEEATHCIHHLPHIFPRFVLFFLYNFYKVATWHYIVPIVMSLAMKRTLFQLFFPLLPLILLHKIIAIPKSSSFSKGNQKYDLLYDEIQSLLLYSNNNNNLPINRQSDFSSNY